MTTDTPSLALLKGQNADAPAEPAENQGHNGPIDAIEDIKTASTKALETCLADNDTPVPEGWGGMTIEQKRAWVLAKFEENSAAPAETPSPAPATHPAAPAPETAKGKGKKAKAETPAPEAPKTIEAIADATAVLPVAEQTPFDPDPPASEMAPAAEPEKPAKTKGKKAKSTAFVESKTGEIIEPDLLQDIVHEVENMKKEQALDLVGELSEKADIAFFQLGGILSLVSSNGWWQTDDQKYKTFREYVEKEHGLEYRKATYWIAIYNALANSGVPWTKIKEVGWTKLKEIAKILTLDNVDEWVEKAKAVNTLTLHDMVKKETDGAESTGGGLAETEKVTTKTFKVHAGQKEVIEAAIKKAKETSGTEVDTVALEYICQDFLGGSGQSQGSLTGPQKLAQLVKGLDLEVVMHVVDEAFPHFDFTVDKKE